MGAVRSPRGLVRVIDQLISTQQERTRTRWIQSQRLSAFRCMESSQLGPSGGGTASSGSFRRYPRHLQSVQMRRAASSRVSVTGNVPVAAQYRLPVYLPPKSGRLLSRKKKAIYFLLKVNISHHPCAYLA